MIDKEEEKIKVGITHGDGTKSHMKDEQCGDPCKKIALHLILIISLLKVFIFTYLVIRIKRPVVEKNW